MSSKSFISFLREQAGEDTIIGSVMEEILSDNSRPKSRVTYKRLLQYMSEKGFEKPAMDALYKAWRRFARKAGISNSAETRSSVTRA